MSELKTLKAGESLDFKVGDQTLTIEALPYGQLKKILKFIFDVGKEIKAGTLTEVTDVADRYMSTMLPLLFRTGAYPFLTSAWIDDNLTIPQIRRIVEAAVVVNGLDDFLGKGKLSELINPRATPETPSESSGSTTSAASPTDGGPRM